MTSSSKRNFSGISPCLRKLKHVHTGRYDDQTYGCRLLLTPCLKNVRYNYNWKKTLTNIRNFGLAISLESHAASKSMHL